MNKPDLLLSPARMWTGLLAFALIVIFMVQILAVVRREVITYDEGYHTYAGVRYWQCADFGVNPEHPPLAKFIAALPLVFAQTPAPAGPCPVASTMKGLGYGESDEWLYGSHAEPPRVDVDSVIWRARLSMSLFAVALALTVSFFTRRLYGDASALVALGLIAFEPTLIAHGALVTTDMALSAMSLLAVYAYYRYQQRPNLLRLLLGGVCCGLTFSVKHSGVLLVPVLLVLAAVEVFVEWRARRADISGVILRKAAALLVIFAIGVGVLWATYLFRYAARPGGATLTLSLADFIADTTAKSNRSFMLHIIPTLARFHLLPEAYLYGFVDVLSISNPGQSSFLLGHLYPHGVPQYFPIVVLIKSTLGMLALGVLAVVAALRRRLAVDMRAAYLLTPAAVWMLGGMGSTLNIGYRHVLPIVAPACCLIGAATVALWRGHGRAYRVVLALLLAAHAASSLASFPNQMAYGNEAFGGVRNSHNLLTDSNNDWSQALPQLAEWLHQHEVSDCWLAYDGMAHPDHSGVPCRYLIQNLFGVNGPPPPDIATGTFVISGLSLSGIEWERPDLNPYAVFQSSRPVAVIGGAEMVYQGTYDMSRVVAVHNTVQAMMLNGDKRYEEALPLAQSAVRTLPTSGLAHLQLANALKGLGRRDEAHAEYLLAEEIASAQPEWYFLQRPEIQNGVRETTTP
jgi:4-amino-4-deoxy-L-arabinose transferase-like glycosyltransferase